MGTVSPYVQGGVRGLTAIGARGAGLALSPVIQFGQGVLGITGTGKSSVKPSFGNTYSSLAAGMAAEVYPNMKTYESLMRGMEAQGPKSSQKDIIPQGVGYAPPDPNEYPEDRIPWSGGGGGGDGGGGGYNTAFSLVNWRI